MFKFEQIEKNCIVAMKDYDRNIALAFQVGYYKAQTNLCCLEIECLEQEIESLKIDIQKLLKEIA